MANQDGGAHVDPKLDEDYARLVKYNSLGYTFEKEGKNYPLINPEKTAIRQIAHEVLRTLIPNYRKMPIIDSGVIYAGISITPGIKISQLPKSKKINRNDPCPCGSGKKYKKCHGIYE